MERSNKRGKIPQSDWPLIMARYGAGETLASIARTYDCSPPAISYVVSKSRARQPARDSSAASPGGPEAQLIKGGAGDPREAGNARRPRLDPPAAPAAREGPVEAMPTEPDAAGAPVPQHLGKAGDHRTPHGTEGFFRDGGGERNPRPPHQHAPVPAPGGAGNGRPAPVGTATRAAAQSPPPRGDADISHKPPLSLDNGAVVPDGSSELVFPPTARSLDNGRPAQAHTARPPYPIPNRPAAAGFSEPGPLPEPPLRQSAREGGAGAAPGKERTGAFIDQQLRTRVDTDIAAFLAAFDAALTSDTQENRAALREATDRLLRAGARTRIELERLEARVPLTVHDRGGDPGAWRYR
jgi:hypothetical protein